MPVGSFKLKAGIGNDASFSLLVLRSLVVLKFLEKLQITVKLHFFSSNFTEVLTKHFECAILQVWLTTDALRYNNADHHRCIQEKTKGTACSFGK